MIALGSPAPDFSLAEQDGRTVTLKDLRGKPVVIFFYPRDHTPVCTKEACAFRDQYAPFQKAGAVILGISSDDTASHARFVKDLKLPFPLLSDPGGKVRKLYDVPKTLGFLPGRATYVIDKDGLVRLAFSSAFNAQAHVDQALKALA